MTKVAILQSNYIPWKGYFDLIAAVDLFIFYDNVQYTKNDWRNRNKICTPKGSMWLTTPVSFKSGDSILQAKISDPKFAIKHWKTLQANYAKCSYFEEISVWLKPIYHRPFEPRLSHWNINLIKRICNYLKINTKFAMSTDFRVCEGKTTRLVNLCSAVEAEAYVSGRAAKSYLEVDKFDEQGIKVQWFDYNGYPEYPQRSKQFDHHVSILDLLFNCGPSSADYMLMDASAQNNHWKIGP